MDGARLAVWNSTCSIVFTRTDAPDQIELVLPRLALLGLCTRVICSALKFKGVTELRFSWPRGGVVAIHDPVGLIADIAQARYTTPQLVCTPVTSPRSSDVLYHHLADTCWNVFKQNEHLRRRNIRRVQNLTPKQSTDLKTAILDVDFATCYSAGKLLFDVHNLRSIPLRFHLVSQDCAAVVQGQVSTRMTGMQTTVSQALMSLVPETIGHPTRVFSHGVSISPELPLAEFLAIGAYADGWLRFAIAMEDTAREDVTHLPS